MSAIGIEPSLLGFGARNARRNRKNQGIFSAASDGNYNYYALVVTEIEGATSAPRPATFDFMLSPCMRSVPLSFLPIVFGSS